MSFSYASSDKPILEDISFSVPVGSITALVGHSGSGKTTLAGLLPRFYGYSKGHILLDGNELADYRLPDLRRQIALVSQDVVLFNDTIAGNIAYGALADAPREAVLEAAEDTFGQATHAIRR